MPARLPSCRPFRARNRAAALLAVVVAGVGCREEPPEVEGDASELPSAVPAPSLAGVDAAAPPPPPSASVQLARAEPESLPPQLGALAYATTIYEKPKSTSRKLGYLRVGARVGRSEEPVGKRGCKGGWYRIEPEGYVCVGTDATLDMRHPLLRAASVRPAKDRPMPYRYGFVRSVLPLYLRVPSSQQQFKSEFKLKEHLEWFQEHRDEVQRAEVGASDLPVDKWGRVLRGKRAGELGRRRNSSELGVGQLFGGLSSEDPWPFWLREGQRLIPNISGFHVPQYAVFADRARRHTGLAFVGSFATDAHHLGRRFAVTTDLRLAPTTKVK
ncbi:MAG: L,D-transpeptidase, partial [Myxococcota bacterium]